MARSTAVQTDQRIREDFADEEKRKQLHVFGLR
jgi:hypothetical protein